MGEHFKRRNTLGQVVERWNLPNKNSRDDQRGGRWGRVGLSAENPFKVSVGLFAR